MDPWTDRCGSHSHRPIWILTLKGAYAEGLQQRERKEEIDIWRLVLVPTFRFFTSSDLIIVHNLLLTPHKKRSERLTGSGRACEPGLAFGVKLFYCWAA